MTPVASVRREPIVWDVRSDPDQPTRLLVQFDDAAPIVLTPSAVLALMNAMTSQMLRCLEAECAASEAGRQG